MEVCSRNERNHKLVTPTLETWLAISCCISLTNSFLALNNKSKLLKKSGFVVKICFIFNTKQYLPLCICFISFSNSKEKVLDGVSSKDINLDNKVETILLNSEQNYIVITSESSGPLPIILNIKDKEGKIIKSLTNETDTYTNFIVSAKDLEKTYNIERTNGFGIVIKTIKIN